jgi:hypothetical protein
MKRYLEYLGFFLLGALVMAASIASASYVTGVPGGWYPIGIFTQPDEKAAGEGPIFTAAGDVVETRCYFVQVPGEGALYYDPHDPETTVCIHPQGAPAEVSSGAVSGQGMPENCQRDPDSRLWCSPSRGALSAGVLKKAYVSRYLPH